MAFKIPELTQGTTTTTGTGTYTVASTTGGFRGFVDELSSGDTTIYAVFDTTNPPIYEINIGVWTDNGSYGTLTRGTRLKSSTGAAINWGAGSKNVVAGLPGILIEDIFDPTLSLGLLELTGAGPNTFSTTPASANGKSLINTTYSGMRTLLGLVIGTNVQAWDADLDTISGLAKTDNNVIKGTGAAWESAALDSLEVTHTPTSPVTTTTVGAAIGQLATLFSRNYSQTSQTNAQSVSTTGITAFTDLDNLSIPGTGDSAKVYQVEGQVGFTGFGGTVRLIVKAHVGSGGNTADAVIGTFYGVSPNPPSSGSVTVPIPPRAFVPGASDKVTISVTSPDDSAFDVCTGAGESFVVIKQISNA